MFELTLQERSRLNAINDEQARKFQKQLRSNRNKTFAITLIRTLHGQIDATVKKAIVERGIRFDCKPGCNHCCSLRVEVLPPEVFLIARELKKLDSAKLAALTQQIEEQANYAMGRAMEDYRWPCAMLKDGSCSIYAVRPSMCRKLYSLDVNSCNSGKMEALEDTKLFLELVPITVGANDGYGKANLPNLSHEFSQALLIALTETDAEERWYRGEPVFPMLPDQHLAR